MKWITRRKARVDRIACPWLIRRFIDPEAEFLFVAEDQVMDTAHREAAVPFDVPGVELGHHGERCSFDAFLEKYRLTDPALLALGEIVRGADTDARHLAREAWGLYAVASGFREIARDDVENMALQFPVYDALYAYCRAGHA
ncbi:MAG TPA: chromate resistance protein ChrB domain-containing protein [Candidatus Deferrimicrobiaceae bacterium]|nr:chromate resistance protein ChrB domain-containing protein [Candidatus Deferrimicrobiaceae bacterium]